MGRRRVTERLPLEVSKMRAATFGEFFSSIFCQLREAADAEAPRQVIPPDY